ncbi:MULTISPECIES: histone deacetylase [unclassified Arcicella]|uniref:histone deacetylase family protein n=1 Tax=unclassified Arcicella TaxID=2644986 RepID=UPI00285A5F0C|nr:MULTISPECIES: histone deacetylase [unclassified Arcicella]MDR6561622.1 acetoin utilization deacetylase AcuC-like enzyme [Arcicella sp. BE51]MDR6812402.1 acetoin utilization deacetylase AcuC-like enzyme [Arcicella sp. BE140]MDR6823826.1 acetoin utilization deacetylase AcuC-like enzyme [Arcicella sp. BE139]
MLKIAYSPIYQHPLPEGHRFPMLKYELIPEQLLYEGTCDKDNFFEPSPVDEQWIVRTHKKQYWEDLKFLRLDPKMIRKIGFPLSEELVCRETIITQGTIDCCHFALANRIAMNVAGGTHHAYSDKGEGFCLLNDVAVASNYLIDNGLATKILIIDLDVHQGNGTAEIFQDQANVFTFSMHGQENYPLHKEKSDLDISLETYTKDEEYLNILYQTLPALIKQQKPDFLFYISGVDILATDKLGKLSMTKEGCYWRDEFVFEQAINNKLPIVVSMGGGYSPKIIDIVDAHCNTFRLAQKMFFDSL